MDEYRCSCCYFTSDNRHLFVHYKDPRMLKADPNSWMCRSERKCIQRCEARR